MTDQENLTPPGLPNNISSPAIDKIAAALARAQGEIEDVFKSLTGSVEGTSKASGKSYKYDYKYAGLDAVMDAVRTAASKNELALLMRPTGNMLHTVLSHSSGQWIDYGNYPLGNADKHQERGSSLTYARRYVTCCVYGVAPAADEDDGKGGNDSLGKRDWRADMPQLSIPLATPKEARETARARNARWDTIKKEILAAETQDDLKRVWAENYTHIQAFGDELTEELVRHKDTRKSELTQDAAMKAGMPDDFNNTK